MRAFVADDGPTTAETNKPFVNALLKGFQNENLSVETIRLHSLSRGVCLDNPRFNLCTKHNDGPL